MKGKVSIVLAAVVCSSLFICSGLAYVAVVEIENNSIDTTSRYCTIDVGEITGVTFACTDGSNSAPIIFTGAESVCTVNYTSVPAKESLLIITFTGTDPRLSDSIITITDTTLISTLGSSCFVRDSVNGSYVAKVSGLGPVQSGGSFQFSAEITLSSASTSTDTAGLIMDVDAYPLISEA